MDTQHDILISRSTDPPQQVTVATLLMDLKGRRFLHS